MASQYAIRAKERDRKVMQKEEKWWDMHDRVSEQLQRADPRLDAESRAWLVYNRRVTVFNKLPYDMRKAIYELKKMVDNGLGGKLPLAEEAIKEAKPREKKGSGPDTELAAAVQKDPFSQKGDIDKFWKKFFDDYRAFADANGRRPSTGAENAEEHRLAYNYNYCLRLGREGKLPLEAEILYSKINPAFDVVEAWKGKLLRCSRIFACTGERPSLFKKSQRALAYWYHEVFNLHASNRLSPKAEWLSANFGHIHTFNRYLELAHKIGAQNITPDSHMREAARLAKWREVIIEAHSKGKLAHDLVVHFNVCSGFIPEGHGAFLQPPKAI